MSLLMGLNISELYHMCCWGTSCAFTLFHIIIFISARLFVVQSLCAPLFLSSLSSHPTAGRGRWLLLTQPCSAEGLFLLKLSSTY